jgi:hypothetical protein
MANAVFHFVLGILLLTGTWDGLWDALDLPQGQPALFVQVGGAGLVGLAYLLWRAADAPPLRAAVALASAIVDGLASLIVLIWLVTDELPEDVDVLGIILLVALGIVLAVFAALNATVASERPEPEEFKHRDQPGHRR